MNEAVQRICDLILANREVLKKVMKFEIDPNTYAIMGALINAGQGVRADIDRYKACKKMLEKNTGFFSDMRGEARALVITKMTMVEDPETFLRGVLTVHQKIRSLHKFASSPYVVMPAITIYEHAGLDGADAAIEKMEVLFRYLKSDHPFLIGDTDRGYLSMLATEDIDPAVLSKNIDEAYQACKKLSIDKDSVHTMAQFLALSRQSSAEKVAFITKIVNGLKANGSAIEKSFGLPALGALALLGLPAEQLIEDITEASAYFKGKPGFKWISVSKGLRTVYAALAVFIAYAGDRSDMGGNVAGNIAMFIAEELSMFIIITVMNAILIANAN